MLPSHGHPRGMCTTEGSSPSGPGYGNTKSHGFATCSEMIWKKWERNVNQTIPDQVRLKCCKVKQAKRQNRNKVEFIYSTLRLKNEKQALIGSKF
ncbi:hypothetical protein DKX38_012158 [Salix brachista]|uniref:Uncharacterized protein n=1 Tax=Salix brachista TaxID=2182728 RepID=A0A5N5LQ14_9ROSI|nr:hypothetical protein DKX38_012158 [Salix brachista]